jgi:hypothetical protein
MAPIMVVALQDGTVLFDGENTTNPVRLASTNQWFILDGFNARNGHTDVIVLLGSNNLGRRLIGWNSAADQPNNAVFHVSGINTVIEDCAGWGDNAQTVFKGSGGSLGSGTGYRRCWGEFNDHPEGTLTPGATVRPSIGQRYENVIGTWNRTGQ